MSVDLAALVITIDATSVEDATKDLRDLSGAARDVAGNLQTMAGAFRGMTGDMAPLIAALNQVNGASAQAKAGYWDWVERAANVTEIASAASHVGRLTGALSGVGGGAGVAANALKGVGGVAGGALVVGIAAAGLAWEYYEEDVQNAQRAHALVINTLGDLQGELQTTRNNSSDLAEATSISAQKSRDAAEAYDLQATAASNAAQEIQNMTAMQRGQRLDEIRAEIKSLEKSRTGWNPLRDNDLEASRRADRQFLDSVYGKETQRRFMHKSDAQLYQEAWERRSTLTPRQREYLANSQRRRIEYHEGGQTLDVLRGQERAHVESFLGAKGGGKPRSGKPPATEVDEVVVYGDSGHRGGYAAARTAKPPAIPREPPRDTTAERTAEVDRMLAQAKQEELQSQLALTKDIGERSRLQREIAKGDADAAQKELAAEYKRIQTDEGLTQAGKDELGAKLLAAAFAKARVARDQDRAIVDEEIAARSQETLETQRANYQNTLDVLESEKGVAQTASERHRIDMEILRVKHEQERLELRRIVDQGQILGLGKEEIERAKKRLAALDKIQANETKAAEASVTLAEAYEALSSAVSAMVGAFKSHDWVGVFKGLNNAIKSVTDAYKAGAANGGGRFGGTVSAVGAIAGAIAPLVGGRAGSALSGLAAGVQIGSMLGGPVGAVVGGIIGTIGGALAGGKRPTNAGALATFNADGTAFSLSGDKRTSETSGMATSAGNAILQGQQFLQSAGIKLGATVTSIDIGVRDMTDIILSDGRALTSAVGDPAAAAETALKALLEGATYASDAQKQLVESMLAAGRGFDDISVAIQNFNQTMQASREFGTNVDDEILRLTDAQAYDVEMLRRAQAARAAELDSYLAGGFITQEAFDKLAAKLKQLDGLELTEVMGRYSDSVEDATASLTDAISAQLAAVSGSLNDWTTIKNKLLDFQKSLTSGDLSGASGKQSLAMARQAFEKVAARVAAKDRGALDELPGAGKAYVDALKASARTPEELARGLNRVKSVVGDATTFAGLRQDEAITQLNNINSSILAVRDAILAESAAANTVPGFANGGSFTVGGSGGVDSQLVMFKATPGEVVDIHNGRPPQNVGLLLAANSNGNAAEIAALRADINGLRADNQALMRRVAEATEKTNITLRRVTRDGDSLVTTAA